MPTGRNFERLSAGDQTSRRLPVRDFTRMTTIPEVPTQVTAEVRSPLMQLPNDANAFNEHLDYTIQNLVEYSHNYARNVAKGIENTCQHFQFSTNSINEFKGLLEKIADNIDALKRGDASAEKDAKRNIATVLRDHQKTMNSIPRRGMQRAIRGFVDVFYRSARLRDEWISYKGLYEGSPLPVSHLELLMLAERYEEQNVSSGDG